MIEVLNSAEVLEAFARGLAVMNEPGAEAGLAHQVAKEWYRLFRLLTSVDAFDFNGQKDILLESGKALGVAGAAFCLLEAQRTTVFLRGVEKAVRELQRRFPGERIRVLYAGCGPFASLVTPLVAQFSAREVGWRLLEINPTSLAAVQRLYAALELEEYLLGTELADASGYVMREPFHLVVTETMQRALQNETQLAIALNLLPQLQPGALFLPEHVGVYAEVARWKRDEAGLSRAFFERVGTVYEVGQEWKAAPEPCRLRVPVLREPGRLCLTTEVRVFGEERLAGNDTSITLPRDLRRVVGGGEEFGFEYRWRPRPGFVCE